MKALTDDGAKLLDMPPIEHDRDESSIYHGHLSPRHSLPLGEEYEIGHGFPCEWVVARGSALYLLHRHGEDSP